MKDDQVREWIRRLRLVTGQIEVDAELDRPRAPADFVAGLCAIAAGLDETIRPDWIPPKDRAELDSFLDTILGDVRRGGGPFS